MCIQLLTIQAGLSASPSDHSYAMLKKKMNGKCSFIVKYYVILFTRFVVMFDVCLFS